MHLDLTLHEFLNPTCLMAMILYYIKLIKSNYVTTQAKKKKKVTMSFVILWVMSSKIDLWKWLKLGLNDLLLLKL